MTPVQELKLRVEVVPAQAVECLSSAIHDTAFAAKEADGMTLLILQSHLKRLCKTQRKLIAAVALREG